MEDGRNGMAEFSDYFTQRVYEAGITDTLRELFPDEPSAEDREVMDQFFNLQIEELSITREVTGPDYTREEIDDMQREMVGDAMDEQMNWPHR